MLGLAIFVYFYVALALVAIGRRLNVNHRWRAFLPILNIHLFMNLAGKKWQWFLGFILSVIAFTILAGISTVVNPNTEYLMSTGEFVQYPAWISRFLGFLMAAYILGIIYFFTRLASSLVLRFGRPWWWGPIIILIPPVGLVLFGRLAWPKREDT